MDNDDALKRQGVKPTYKKKKGFQCLNLTWEGRFIHSLFRSGEKHSNHGNDVQRAVKKIVKMIRKKYREDAAIILTCDSGFLSEENLNFSMTFLKFILSAPGKCIRLYNIIFYSWRKVILIITRTVNVHGPIMILFAVWIVGRLNGVPFIQVW